MHCRCHSRTVFSLSRGRVRGELHQPSGAGCQKQLWSTAEPARSRERALSREGRGVRCVGCASCHTSSHSARCHCPALSRVLPLRRRRSALLCSALLCSGLLCSVWTGLTHFVLCGVSPFSSRVPSSLTIRHTPTTRIMLALLALGLCLSWMIMVSPHSLATELC